MNGIQLVDPTTLVALVAKLQVPWTPPLALIRPENVDVPLNEEVPVTPKDDPTLTYPLTFIFPLSTPIPP